MTELVLVTKNGLINRLKLEDIRITSRGTRGVIAQRLDEGDEIVAMALLKDEE